MALRSQRTTARPRGTGCGPLRRWVGVWCLVAAGVATACNGGSSPEASSAPPSTAAPSSSIGPDGPSSTSSTAKPEREYPAGGPTDDIFPPGDPSYELIDGPGCQTLLDETTTWVGLSVPDAEGADTVPLYAGAASACLGRWSDAERNFEQIDVAHPDFQRNVCVRTELLAWLTRLIHEWQADHSFSPVFRTSSGSSPCPGDDTSSTGSPDEPPSSSTSSAAG